MTNPDGAREDFASAQNREQLRLLAIFHYVVGGLAGVFSLFPVIHLVMGIAMVTGRMDGPDQDGVLFGWFFILFAAGMIIFGASFAVCLVLAGRFLMKRVHYTFCFVMAALACMFFPFGTVLGIFTIIVLSRTGVRDLFDLPNTPPRPV
ncbi:MAG TPA: hypothetical protein VE379_12110 [Vicinamibacterales bacterium]|jgi:hypothetical protein|nr:hypothetical protein [Vicinamibacterales bacterium]